jgi:hypothetical protein
MLPLHQIASVSQTGTVSDYYDAAKRRDAGREKRWLVEPPRWCSPGSSAPFPHGVATAVLFLIATGLAFILRVRAGPVFWRDLWFAAPAR